MWNQGSSYLIYWQLGARFQIYRELEDQGMYISIYTVYMYVYLQNIAQSSSSFFQQASMLKSQLLKRWCPLYPTNLPVSGYDSVKGMITSVKKADKSSLVGGWTNPFEKYARQNGNLPQIGVNIKNIWNHQLDQLKNTGTLIHSIPFS